MLKKQLIFLVAVFTLLLTNSCGYKFGSLMHPQVKSVAIGQIINDTTTFNASVQLKQLLTEAFMLDGGLKVVNRRTADSIIYSKILSVASTEIAGRTFGKDNYVPTEWEVRVTIEFSVIIPGQSRPLIPTQTVHGTAIYQVRGDHEISRNYATKMALRDAAQKMVLRTTEAW